MRFIAPLILVLLLGACGNVGSGLFNRSGGGEEAAAPPADSDSVGQQTSGETPEPSGRPAPQADATEINANVRPPAEDARTVEELDTTTEEDRQAALAPPPEDEAAPTETTTTESNTANTTPAPSGDGRLGTTVASIGDPTEPGFWIKTPLVSERQAGRLFYAASGRSVQVQLIPSGGAEGSGSSVSLAAMRLLDAPLEGLPELVVYAN